MTNIDELIRTRDRLFEEAKLLESRYNTLTARIRKVVLLPIDAEFIDLKKKVSYIRKRRREATKEAYLENKELQEIKLKKQGLWREVIELGHKIYSLEQIKMKELRSEGNKPFEKKAREKNDRV